MERTWMMFSSISNVFLPEKPELRLLFSELHVHFSTHIKIHSSTSCLFSCDVAAEIMRFYFFLVQSFQKIICLEEMCIFLKSL